MKKIATHIISHLLILSLTISYVGVNIHHQICECTGDHDISVMKQAECCDCNTDKIPESCPDCIEKEIEHSEIPGECDSYFELHQIDTESLISQNFILFGDPQADSELIDFYPGIADQKKLTNLITYSTPVYISSEMRQLVLLHTGISSNPDEDHIS